MDDMTSPIASGYMNVKQKDVDSRLAAAMPMESRMVSQKMGPPKSSKKVLGNASTNNRSLLKQTSSKTLLQVSGS